MNKIIILVASFVLALLLSPVEASVTYRFTHIVESGDGPGELANGDVGQEQIRVEVAEYSSRQILFTFTNTGSTASSITNIYLDDDAMFRTAMALFDADDNIGDAGVDFTQNAFEAVDPFELPGAELIGFETATALSADSDLTVPDSGVDPGESLGVLLNLSNRTLAFSDVINALDTGVLRIGIYLQNFPDGGSEAFVTRVANPVPGSVILTGIGMGLVGWLRGKRML